MPDEDKRAPRLLVVVLAALSPHLMQDVDERGLAAFADPARSVKYYRGPIPRKSWRIEFPAPYYESKLDILEFKP